ncbi:MAG: hypothetical protein ACXWW0_00235 [Bacteroidia bacterium]
MSKINYTDPFNLLVLMEMHREEKLTLSQLKTLVLTSGKSTISQRESMQYSIRQIDVIESKMLLLCPNISNILQSIFQ